MLIKSIGKWGAAGIVLFFMGISIGMIDYFVYRHSIILNLVAAAALFASIRILSVNNLPVLKLLVGVSLTAALFSQAYFIESLFSAILGIVMLTVSAAEYRKDVAKNA